LTAPDPQYVAARRALLDALEGLSAHLRAVVVVGAQAVYLRAGGELAGVAAFTTDGDLALDPALLPDEPPLEAVMIAAGFELEREPGVWYSRPGSQDYAVPVDLIVPEGAAAPGGRRGARLGPHGKRAAHRAVGLEAALVDHAPLPIAALDPSDERRIEVAVAGVAALLIAKAHKLHDRLRSPRPGRAEDKDAADIYRLMRTSSPVDIAATLSALREHPVAGPSVTAGVEHLLTDFSRRRDPGVEMAARSLRFAVPQAQVATLCLAYTERLAARLRE
jgi:hypothetical protein